jgi:DNA polymerase I-like protein with 3'-5' exonuclease and polymerase domains
MLLNKSLDLTNVNNISLDTETTGLLHTDRPFSVQIVTDQGGKYYYNLKSYEDSPWLPYITEDQFLGMVSALKDFKGTIYFANALFDLQKLALIGLDLTHCKVICTHSQQRLIDNLNSVSLEQQGKYFGYEKLDTVKEYIKTHRLYEDIVFRNVPLGKKPLFSKVPWGVISPYGITDAKITLQIGLNQQDLLKNNYLAKQEQDLTLPLFRIKSRGLRLDIPYAEEKLAFHQAETNKYFLKLGVDFKDGKTKLTEIFNKHCLPIKYNPKTREPHFSDAHLKPYKHIEDIQNILKYRKHSKLYRTFYLKLLFYSHDAILYPDLIAHGTTTGRMASYNPNFQNLNKEVKHSIIPREGYFFLEADYQALELRLTYDQSGETKMINVINSGQDMHQTMADMLKVDRDTAKTAIFSILYGSGPTRLSSQLNITKAKAAEIINNIRSSIPKVMAYQTKHQAHVKTFQYTKNALGRVMHFLKGDEYKVLNAVIQGLGGDIIKRAIIDCDQFLKDKKASVALSVHDSILFEIPFNEAHIQNDLLRIMEQAYTPKNGLHLKVTAKHSTLNYGSMIDGIYQS